VRNAEPLGSGLSEGIGWPSKRRQAPNFVTQRTVGTEFKHVVFERRVQKSLNASRAMEMALLPSKLAVRYHLWVML
jgi:hypothetical protein